MDAFLAREIRLMRVVIGFHLAWTNLEGRAANLVEHVVKDDAVLDLFAVGHGRGSFCAEGSDKAVAVAAVVAADGIFDVAVDVGIRDFTGAGLELRDNQFAVDGILECATEHVLNPHFEFFLVLTDLPNFRHEWSNLTLYIGKGNRLSVGVTSDAVGIEF